MVRRTLTQLGGRASGKEGLFFVVVVVNTGGNAERKV